MKKHPISRYWKFWACLVLFGGIMAWKAGDRKAGVLPPDDPTKHPVPHMHVGHTVSVQEETNFKRFSKILSTHIGNQPETESFYYDTAAFMGMGRAMQGMGNAMYLEVFLAVYGAAGSSPYVPAGWDNKLTFLYAPTDASGNQLGYYTLPDNATTFSLVNNKIPDDVAKSWMTIYDTTVVRWLLKYLDLGDTYNYVDNNTGYAPTNTLKIKYYLSDFDELRDEMDYQASEHKDTITGFKAFFAALPEKAGGGNGTLSNRLKVEFEFTQRDKRLFFIDTTPGFPRRPVQRPHFPLVKKGITTPAWFSVRGLNNGQLCPPTCNP